MIRARALAPLLLLVAGCDDYDARAAWREMRAAEGALALGRDGRAAEIDMGGDGAVTPPGGIRDGEWQRWARTAWPAACRRLQTVERVGRVARAGRTCASVAVSGIVPAARVIATGTLVAGGARFPVGWRWTTGDVRRACATDPLDEAPHRFRLSRSRREQHWHATPLPVAAPFEADGVQETCAGLPRFLDDGPA